MLRGTEWWDNWFLGMAQYVSSASKDPSTKVGAVIAKGKYVVSLGYNGLPEEMEDLPEILNNREEKLKHIIHGEINAIDHADDVSGCTLYTYPFMPCDKCALKVAKSGIIRVVSLDNNNPRWYNSFINTRQIFKDFGIELIEYAKLEYNI